jgi:hypothetical protein
MADSFVSIIELLTRPGCRLHQLVGWLQANAWSEEKFGRLKPLTYLEDGERKTRWVEEMVLNAAPMLYDEVVATSIQVPSLLSHLINGKPTAVVVFDGASIRELPLLSKLARETGYRILESSYSVAGLPSETESFIEQRLLGKPLSPSQLETRKELRGRNVRALYYETPLRSFELPPDGQSFLLWSSFPDGTYMNLEAQHPQHFEAMLKQFDVAWRNTVLAVPPGYRIIVTSDHGYIYFGVGMESERRCEDALRLLESNRFKVFSENETMPEERPELHIIGSHRLAMLRGRIKNRMQGHAGNKLFRHGGMSLTEMLTPWLVIQR